MAFSELVVINQYLSTQLKCFTLLEFHSYLKKKGLKISKKEAVEILYNSDLVFSYADGKRFITRAGVFTGKVFSFMPSKEEVQKGYIIIGHRCLPFVNPYLQSDRIIVSNANHKYVKQEAVTFSMNLAMDVFALFGEGYVLPRVINDHSNEDVPLSSLQYSLPQDITLTAWSLKEIAGDLDFTWGDRILGKVINWEENLVEFTVQKAESFTAISSADIEREEWYGIFEQGLLNGFDSYGPTDSIEQQLALLYMDYGEQLCCKNCGSAEEFLKHTKKIGFSAYGIESRIWRVNETVPFIGPWNENLPTDAVLSDMSITFSPLVIDAFLRNNLWVAQENKKEEKTIEQLMDDIFPRDIRMTPSERKMVLLNIEKRNGIIKDKYNQFADYSIAKLRKRVLELYIRVNSLLCGITCSDLRLKDFPQQELVMLVQFFAHLTGVIEQMENVHTRDMLPVDDISLSVEGIEFTFDDIEGFLKKSLDENTYKKLFI